MDASTLQPFMETDKVRGNFLLGNTLEILRNPVQFLSKLAKDHGPVVTVNFAGKKFYVLQHPDYIKHVLLDNYKQYRKPGATQLLREFLGDGLSTSNDELWLRQRRLMQPAFHKQQLNTAIKIIHEEATIFIDRLSNLPANTKININHELLQLTICIISRAMFNADLNTEMDTMVNSLEQLAAFASSWMKSLVKIPTHWPTPANKMYRKNSKIFNEIIYGIIARRKKEIQNRTDPTCNDLLDMLLYHYDESTASHLPDKLLRDEITTMFMAGHETTAQTLGWALYHIAEQKTISKKLKQESIDVTYNRLLMFDDVPKLVYTRQVIQETLRHYPPIWAVLRTPMGDDKIHSLHLPSKSNVLLNIYGLHHHPSYWSQPTSFNPDHFSAEAEIQRPPYVFIPFGAGPRLCLGHNFAMLVMQVVLSRIIKVFEFTVPAGFTPEVEPNITLRAKNGIQLIINKI